LGEMGASDSGGRQLSKADRIGLNCPANPITALAKYSARKRMASPPPLLDSPQELLEKIKQTLAELSGTEDLYHKELVTTKDPKQLETLKEKYKQIALKLSRLIPGAFCPNCDLLNLPLWPQCFDCHQPLPKLFTRDTARSISDILVTSGMLLNRTDLTARPLAVEASEEVPPEPATSQPPDVIEETIDVGEVSVAEVEEPLTQEALLLMEDARLAMSNLLSFMIQGISSDASKAAEEKYLAAIDALATAVASGHDPVDLERDLLMRPLSVEEDGRAKSLVSLYTDLQRGSPGAPIEHRWEFTAVDYLTSKRKMSVEDAARIIVGRKRTSVDFVKDMMKSEKELVLQVLHKTGECTASDVSEFMALHPGVRDFMVRNFLASLWTDADWRIDLDRYTSAWQSVYRLCGLLEASPDQKLEAVLKSDLLTNQQRIFVAQAFRISPAYVSSEAIGWFGKKMAAATPEEREAYWQKGRNDVLTLANLIHKVRFPLTEVTYSDDEKKILAGVFKKPLKAILADDVVELSNAMKEKTVEDPDGGSYYPPLFLKVFEYYKREDRYSALSLSELNKAVRAEAEYATLLDFLGMPVQKATGTVDYTKGISRPKFQTNGGYKPVNEDAFTSIVVDLGDGKKIILDAVFDGMGGHQGGAVASKMAKEVFELVAAAGWIKHPEDVRRIFVLIDLVISAEQMKDHDYNKETEARDSMGTTGAVAFQYGRLFYGIHAGDSDYSVLRDGELVFTSRGHSLANEPYVDRLPPELLKKNRHRVMSALGSILRHIHINNTDMGYEPFILEDGDVIKVNSDGIAVPLCDHEYKIVLDSTSDLNAARLKIMDLVEHRNDRGPFQPLCSCGLRPSKDDDKTLILRAVEEGM